MHPRIRRHREIEGWSRQERPPDAVSEMAGAVGVGWVNWVVGLVEIIGVVEMVNWWEWWAEAHPTAHPAMHLAALPCALSCNTTYNAPQTPRCGFQTASLCFFYRQKPFLSGTILRRNK
ncbi:TPA: hypothetical protein ACQUIH_001733 [Neisseria lactamica]|uniref:hypothetical protein n=1 Tax=Neisseria lactamica TaxID=486 RepID=UPI0027DEE8BE|nr:hypothetical protein [Neisseria lactamica]